MLMYTNKFIGFRHQNFQALYHKFFIIQDLLVFEEKLKMKSSKTGAFSSFKNIKRPGINSFSTA